MSDKAKRKQKKKIEVNTNSEVSIVEQNLNLKCIIDGCESSKTFPSIASLASHIRAAHRGQYIPPKKLKEMLINKKEKVNETINNIEEVKEVSEQKAKEVSIDTSEVLAKIEEINKKVPADLCDKFPELCKLGDKVDKLSGDVEDLKGNQIKKLVLQVPKQETSPAVDMSITDSKLERLNNSVMDVNNKLDSMSGKDKRPQTKKSKPAQVDKVDDEEDKDKEIEAKENKDITSLVNEAVNKAIESVKLSSTEHHKEISVDEIINCPQCKKKVLDKLIEKNKDTDSLDPAVMTFMESMGFVKKGEKKEEEIDANKETINDEKPDERSLSGSAKPSAEAGDATVTEPIGSEVSGSEQRPEGEPSIIKEEAGSKETGTGEDAKEVKATAGVGGGTESGSDSGNGSSGSEQPATTTTEPKRCRLLFRPNR